MFFFNNIKGLPSINNFKNRYQAFCFAVGNKDISENTGKVILCQQALNELQHLINERNPLIFELVSEKGSKRIHVGVLEFSASNGKILMPFWVCCIFI
jgi:hypothetical protein